MNISLIIKIFLIFVSTTLMRCGGPKTFQVPPQIPDDRNHVPPPKSKSIHTYSEYFDKQIILQIDEAVDLARQYRNLTGTRKEAKNVDAFGEIPNSSWFTNRNGQRKMTLEEIKRGSNKNYGPDTSDVWVIIRAKTEGVTPGFSIRDSRGDTYLIKFDPLGYPGLASGAEVISTKLFYAMGYNTPENYVVYFHPRRLELSKNVKLTDKKGRTRFMNQQDLEEILSGIEKLPDGSIRALASKLLDGKFIGPFRYKGVRKDDLNDFIPHHHRRELRGLRIMAAWLNHFDTKDGNSLDMYVTENGKCYVKHYLIDFGATLGSASHGPNHLWRGYQYDVDPGNIIGNILTLGLYVRPWEKQKGVKYPSAGLFNAELFEPMKYKPQVPNPAFENLTLLDGYWAAKIVMSISDEQLRAVMKEGQYSDPEAEEFLFQLIKERRNKIGRYFFSRITPLDNFTLKSGTDGSQSLKFEDLAIEGGLHTDKETSYFYEIEMAPQQKLNIQAGEFSGDKSISLSDLQKQLFFDPGFGEYQTKNYQIEVRIKLKRAINSDWSQWVRVYLEPDITQHKFKLIGVSRKN